MFINNISLLSIYNFKAFKKNIKFKKYNYGITKFIKNRKKYVLRKKVTNYVFLYNIAYTWSKLNVGKRYYTKYVQLLNCFKYFFTDLNLISLQRNSFNFLNYVTLPKKILIHSIFFTKGISFKTKLMANQKQGFWFTTTGIRDPNTNKNFVFEDNLFSMDHALLRSLQNSTVTYKDLLNAIFVLTFKILIHLRRLLVLLCFKNIKL